eukprot:EST48645.1 Hypothetical protein SS50377_11258 [Spironucleus salmonicida]
MQNHNLACKKSSQTLDKDKYGSFSKNRLPIAPKDEYLSTNKLTQSKYEPIKNYNFDFQSANKNQRDSFTIYSNQISNNLPIPINILNDISVDSTEGPNLILSNMSTTYQQSQKDNDLLVLNQNLRSQNLLLVQKMQDLEEKLKQFNNQQSPEAVKQTFDQERLLDKLSFYQKENIMLREKFAVQENKMSTIKQDIVQQLNYADSQKIITLLE